MPNYQPPADEKVASYYISPQEQMTKDPEKTQDTWYNSWSTHRSPSELEAGLLSPSNPPTPPPAYSAPGDEEDDLDDWCCPTTEMACGMRRGRNKFIVTMMGMVVFAWVVMGGMAYSNPMMWPVYGEKSEPFDWGPKAPDGYVVVPHHMPLLYFALGHSESEVPRTAATPASDESSSKPTNKPLDCNHLVWREGQLRTDGCSALPKVVQGAPRVVQGKHRVVRRELGAARGEPRVVRKEPKSSKLESN